MLTIWQINFFERNKKSFYKKFIFKLKRDKIFDLEIEEKPLKKCFSTKKETQNYPQSKLSKKAKFSFNRKDKAYQRWSR